MNILNDVLDHSKIEAGKLVLEHGADVTAQPGGVGGALFRANAENKGLKLLFEVEQDVANWVIGDAQRLKQVLLNLVGNAIKFTERGSVTLRLTPLGRPRRLGTCRVRGRGHRDRPVGRGSGAAVRPFHQADGSRNRRRGGTGLGLAISQRIIEAMGGSIQVRSETGVGSTFWLRARSNSTSPVPPVLTDSRDGRPGRADGPHRHRPPGRGQPGQPADRDRDAAVARPGRDRGRGRRPGAQAAGTAPGRSGADGLPDADHGRLPPRPGHIRARERAGPDPPADHRPLTANAFEDDLRRAEEAGMDAHPSKPYCGPSLRAMLSRWL